MIPCSIVQQPWIKVAADICELKGRNLLVVVNCFSNFVEVIRLSDITSVSVIRALSDIFARWGVPRFLSSTMVHSLPAQSFHILQTSGCFIT